MEQVRPRPFLDTNVLFFGFYRAGSSPATILERHAAGDLLIVVSGQVLEELERTIRRKQPALLPLLDAFLIAAPPEVTMDPPAEVVQDAERSINPTDAPILAAAVVSGADCLISGNTRHFTQVVAGCAGIAIFTPVDYLASLREQAPQQD